MKKRFFTKPITVVLSEEVYHTLQEITRTNDASISEWVRDAINGKLKAHKNNQKGKNKNGKNKV
jgi:hypothetical protein